MPKKKESPHKLPPPRSLYRKIQRVLAEARKGQAGGIAALVAQIDRAGHLDFTRFDTSQDKVRVVPCSIQSIQRVVAVCQSLRLLTQAGSLTKSGSVAADPARFDAAIRPCIEVRLQEIGAPLARVRKVAAEVLTKSTAAELPTWDGILKRLANDVTSPKEFKDLLSLLAACGGIATSRRKIYLPR